MRGQGSPGLAVTRSRKRRESGLWSNQRQMMPTRTNPKRGLALAPLAFAAALTLAACGGSDSAESTDSAEDPRDAALASLELTTEAASLDADMAKLVDKLGDEPSAEEREDLAAELERLQQRAAKLVASADAESTFEVELEPIAGSKAAGEATLVEAEGEIALDGSVDSAAKKQTLAVHAFGAGEGASVCPPDDAASGSDEALDGSEAEDFYGPAEVDLGTAESGDVATAQNAGKAPPLTARALVLAGGDAPLACGVPEAEVDVNERTATAETVAATEELQGAALSVVVVLAEPTSDRAQIALDDAGERVESASEHLADSVEIVMTELEGDIEAADQEQIDVTLEALEASDETFASGFEGLQVFIDAELVAQKEREEQREAALVEEAAPAVPDTSSLATGECPPGYSQTEGPSGLFCFTPDGEECRPYPPDQVAPTPPPGVPLVESGGITGTSCSEVGG